MIELTNKDALLSIEEIDKFIERIDAQKFFTTRKEWYKNFENHFKKLIAVDQVLTFRKKGRLIGLCSWALVDKQRKQQINKIRWLLPENVSDGNIIYIDVCLLQTLASIFKIKKFLEEKYKPVVTEIYWFNMPHGRVFRLKFKGG